MLQPDLGTMLVLSATVFGVLAVAGAPRRWLVALVAAGRRRRDAGGLARACSRRTRSTGSWRSPIPTSTRAAPATTPPRPGSRSATAGCSARASSTARRPGPGFVPEQHTDFVFTVAGEELGLIGAGVLILLFAVLLWRALLIAEPRRRHVRPAWRRPGIACWFGFQTFQNIGMCLGIMPVTGVPLPLVSYGGSSMFASLIGVGLLLNIQRRSLSAPGSRVPATRVLAR